MKLLRKPLQTLVVLGMALFAAALHAQVTAPTVIDSTVQLASGAVFYRDSGGSGTPVVFLHAGSGNSMLWEYQIPAFTAAGYRFIAIDYRGVGTSAGSNAPTRIHELVQALQLPAFHLIGTAAGGGTALQYGLAHPDQLRSITVTNSIGNVQDADYAELGRRLRPPAFNELPLELRELGPSYRAANAEGVQHWLQLSEAEAAPAPAVANAPATAASTAVAVTWERLEAFKVPTLLMTGDADLYTPPSVLRLFKQHMPSAEFAIIAETGHSSFWESPGEFNRLVLAFVAKH